MRLLFSWGHSIVSNLKHIRVIPVSRSSKLSKLRVLIEVVLYWCEVVKDILGCSPTVASLLSPHWSIFITPITYREENGSSSLPQGIAHLFEARLVRHASMVAVIILYIIYTPFSEVWCINFFMAHTCSSMFAWKCTSRGVKSKLQPFWVNIVSQSFHSGRESISVYLNVTIFLSLISHPAIINVHILITYFV